MRSDLFVFCTDLFLPASHSVTSIGVFSVAFVIYLYFLISPIVRAKRQAARSKALTNSSSSPLIEKIGIPTRDSCFSFTFVNSTTPGSPSPSPELPRRIVCRDSVGLTKTKRTASIFDMEPLLDNFPLPPSQMPMSPHPRPDNGDSPPHSPTTKFSSLEPVHLVPDNMHANVSDDLPFISLPSFQKLAPMVVLSDSRESIGSGRILISPTKKGPSSRSFQTNPFDEHASLLATFPPKEQATGLRLLDLPRRRGNLDPGRRNPQIVGSAVTQTKSAPLFRDAQTKRPSLIRKSTSHLKELKLNGNTDAPLYADLILPSYCRSQSQADALKLHSHTIRDSVFVRAASYAQKLVGSVSPPKDNAKLHFEIVKGDHGV